MFELLAPPDPLEGFVCLAVRGAVCVVDEQLQVGAVPPESPEDERWEPYLGSDGRSA